MDMSNTLSDLPTDLHRLILSHDEEKIQLKKDNEKLKTQVKMLQCLLDEARQDNNNSESDTSSENNTSDHSKGTRWYERTGANRLRLAIDLGDLDQLVVDQEFECAAQIVEFGFGERHEAPVIGPGIVEDIAQDDEIVGVVSAIDRTDVDTPGIAGQ